MYFRVETEDVRKGQVVNLRFFAGFTAQETADVLGVSITTVEREWRYCRQWLFAQLKASGARGDVEREV